MSKSDADNQERPDNFQKATVRSTDGGRGWQRKLNTWLWSSIKEHARSLVSLVFAFVVISAIVWFHGQINEGLSSIFSWRRGDSSRPKIVLAVFPNDTISDPIKEGLGIRGDSGGIVTNGCTMEFMPEGTDVASTASEVRKALEDPNIVLVIGHYSSTTAEYMLENVYEAKDSPIPLILPAPTNPDLTKASRNGKKPVLRLPATDTSQVQQLGDLLRKLSTLRVRDKKADSPQRVALVVDSSNPRYSDYISLQLVHNNPEMAIVDSVGVSLGGDGFRPQRFTDSKPDVIVFVGMEAEADIFLRAISESGFWVGRQKPTLVFTDGVAGSSFNSVARDTAVKGFRIFLTAPFPTETSKGYLLDPAQFASYRPLGYTARNLAKLILEKAKQDSGEITRKTVSKAMESLYPTAEGVLDDMDLKFNEQGDNIRSEIHVYEMTKNGPIHSCLCSCKQPACSRKSD